ncbi:MAG: hypothetical protein J6L65_11460 [Lachnospiraceae bacterium]|nr:hypothetical protein [Lachnospiraceae bacterium]
MKVIDVYKQYLSGECVYNEVERKGVVVTLTATSDSGNIMYEVGISFFPHRDEKDFGISYDAYASKEIFNEKGRRSKKRDALMLEQVKEVADALAEEMNGVIYWDKPLREAVYG